MQTQPNVWKGLFSLGDLVATPGFTALNVHPQKMLVLLRRHLSGDYGEICAGDATLNDHAIHDGGRIMSVYDVDGVKVWLITEADRSVTTFLLPEEY